VHCGGLTYLDVPEIVGVAVCCALLRPLPFLLLLFYHSIVLKDFLD
jgi:hypothetical protein